ncbi:MAG: PH domain-containing protein [Rheinheimera sp.]
MTNSEMPEAVDSLQHWQRSSAWALLPLLVKAIVQWAGVLVGGAYFSSTDRFSEYMPLIVAALICLVIGSALLNWRFTRFRVSTVGIELRRGVLHKEQLLLAPSRIQELQVQQPFYFKPLHLFTVSLDSAGSTQQEFYLTGLSAQQLALLQGGEYVEQTSPSTPFLRIWFATLYNKHLWLPLLAVLGAAQAQLEGDLWQTLWTQGQTLLQQSGLLHSVALQLFVGLSVLLLVIISLLLMTIIWLYPQRFERDARQLQLTQGTVLKRSQRIQTKRVQLLTVIQPLLARGFGHFSLIFHSFANSQEQKNKFVLLGQTAIDIDQQLQAQQLLALSDIQQLPLQRYLPVYFQRVLLLRNLLLLGLLPVLLLVWQLEVIAWTTATLLWLAVACWLWADWWAFRRWHGYLVQDQVLYLWEGGLGQSWQVLPLWQIQKVQVVQSLFFRQQQLLQVLLFTANGTVTLAALPNGQAQALYAQILALLYPK